MFRKIAIILTAVLFAGTANAASSIRYRPITPAPQRIVHVHHTDTKDEFARNVAITAVVIGVIALIIAADDGVPYSTGDKGFDNYLKKRY